MCNCTSFDREDFYESLKISETDMSPDPDEDALTFKELCGCFHAALSLGPCVVLLDGVNDLGGSIGMTPQEVGFYYMLNQPFSF